MRQEFFRLLFKNLRRKRVADSPVVNVRQKIFRSGGALVKIFDEANHKGVEHIFFKIVMGKESEILSILDCRKKFLRKRSKSRYADAYHCAGVNIGN